MRNIGPIRRAHIDLSGVTVLVGPNASGKTTLSVASYAALRSQDDAARRVLIDAWDQIHPTGGRLPRDADGQAIDASRLAARFAEFFRDTLSDELKRCWTPDLTMLPRRGRTGNGAAPRILVSGETFGDSWTLVFWLRNGRLQLDTRNEEYKLPSFTTLAEDIAKADPPRTHILRLLNSESATRGVYMPAGRSGYVQMQSLLSALLIHALGKGYFEHASVGKIPGTAADFLQFFANLDAKESSAISPDTAARLESELLNASVRMVEQQNARQIEFSPAGVNEHWPIDTAATSIAELAPLILYIKHGLTARDFLFIDEPEAHLHPANQLKLASVLFQLSGHINGLVIGTHSDFFVTGISNALLQSTATARRPNQVPLRVYELRPATRTSGYDGREITVDPSVGFDIEQFSDVAEAAFDEADRLYSSAVNASD
nr:AAA family ATPase [Patulibacter sp. SYSU D01012]